MQFSLFPRGGTVSIYLQISPHRLLLAVDSRNCTRTRKRIDCDSTQATTSPTRASIREVNRSPLLSSRTTLRHFTCRTESTNSQVEPPSPPELTLAIRLLQLSGLLPSEDTTCAVAIQAEHLLSHRSADTSLVLVRNRIARVPSCTSEYSHSSPLHHTSYLLDASIGHNSCA